LKLLLGSGSAGPTPSLRPTSPSRPSRSTHLPGPPAQRPTPPSLPDDRARSPSSSSGQAGLRHTPSVPQPHPSCHGCPSSQCQSSPSSFTPWPLLPPSNHALTHRDEPKITRPLNTTSSLAVPCLHRLGAPPPAPIKGHLHTRALLHPSPPFSPPPSHRNMPPSSPITATTSP
jgi:hypothetical protein